MNQYFIKRGEKLQGPATLAQIENLRSKLKASDLIATSGTGPWTTWDKAESKLFPVVEEVGFADLEIPTFQQSAIPPSAYWQPQQTKQAPQATASKPPKNNKALILGLTISGAVVGLLSTISVLVFLSTGGKPPEDVNAQIPMQSIPLTRKHFQEKVDSLSSKRTGPYKDAIIEDFGRSTVEISKAAMLAVQVSVWTKNPAKIYYTLFDSTYNGSPTPSILDFIVWDSSNYEFSTETNTFKKVNPKGPFGNDYRYRIRIQLTTEEGRWVVTKMEGKRGDELKEVKDKEFALGVLRNEELSKKIEAYFNNETSGDDAPFYQPYWDFPK